MGLDLTKWGHPPDCHDIIEDPRVSHMFLTAIEHPRHFSFHMLFTLWHDVGPELIPYYRYMYIYIYTYVSYVYIYIHFPKYA